MVGNEKHQKKPNTLRLVVECLIVMAFVVFVMSFIYIKEFSIEGFLSQLRFNLFFIYTPLLYFKANIFFSGVVVLIVIIGLTIAKTTHDFFTRSWILFAISFFWLFYGALVTGPA